MTTTPMTATIRPNRHAVRRSSLAAVVLVATIGCASQTDRELTDALRQYVGDSTTTSESVQSAPPPSVTMAPRETTTSSTSTTSTTTTTVPHIGDGHTISRETADQADRCFAGWQTLRVRVESSGRLDRDEFRRIADDCDEAVRLLGLDRSDEAITTGPTEQLHALLLQLRLQWMMPAEELDRSCPSRPSTPCSLGVEAFGGSFDFLVISGPSTVLPSAFLDDVDAPLDVSRIQGLMVE